MLVTLLKIPRRCSPAVTLAAAADCSSLRCASRMSLGVAAAYRGRRVDADADADRDDAPPPGGPVAARGTTNAGSLPRPRAGGPNAMPAEASPPPLAPSDSCGTSGDGALESPSVGMGDGVRGAAGAGAGELGAVGRPDVEAPDPPRSATVMGPTDVRLREAAMPSLRAAAGVGVASTANGAWDALPPSANAAGTSGLTAAAGVVSVGGAPSLASACTAVDCGA